MFSVNRNESPISYHNGKERQIPFFCAEASEIAWDYSKQLILQNKENSKEIVFQFKDKVMDHSEEDVLVYIFRSVSGAKFPCEFHILND